MFLTYSVTEDDFLPTLSPPYAIYFVLVLCVCGICTLCLCMCMCFTIPIVNDVSQLSPAVSLRMTFE